MTLGLGQGICEQNFSNGDLNVANFTGLFPCMGS